MATTRNSGTGRISWIVPVLDDGAAARSVIDRAIRGPESPDEVIVVDASDPPVAFPRISAADLRLEFLRHPPGLAEQMNHGVAASRGEWLLFHYADVWLPDGWRRAVLDAGARGSIAGAFRLDLGPRRRYRAVAAAAHLRERWLGLGPFGDQGIFCRRKDFEAVGGFDEAALAEDLDLVRRLRLRGRVERLPDRILASPRRWESEGFARTAARNCTFLLRHIFGDRSERARDLYRDHRRTGRGARP